MKIKNTLTKSILVLSLSLLSGSIKPVVPPAKESAETEKIIKETFRSSALKADQQKVEILFTTDQNGHVNFALAKTNDSGLKKEIEKQFYTMRFLKLKQDAVNSVILNFKTL